MYRSLVSRRQTFTTKFFTCTRADSGGHAALALGAQRHAAGGRRRARVTPWRRVSTSGVSCSPCLGTRCATHPHCAAPFARIPGMRRNRHRYRRDGVGGDCNVLQPWQCRRGLLPLELGHVDTASRWRDERWPDASDCSSVGALVGACQCRMRRCACICITGRAAVETARCVCSRSPWAASSAASRLRLCSRLQLRRRSQSSGCISSASQSEATEHAATAPMTLGSGRQQRSHWED